ncbi:MAG TPA: class I SAM-dependent methyltransferase [Candidatus Eremiobacteraceae bacterium]|jgi:ubiquinone/menaquinone biosynthesis C-methylase UbiE|nr:class I SAM-dependent methyltransferase [Candidatus Eremiobacteraceae bacterium]
MNLYDRWILPSLLDLAMRQTHHAKYRSVVVGAARGRVLEIGVGSGLNFPFYGKAVEHVLGIDPSPRSLEMARRRAAEVKVPIDLSLGSATDIPIADGAVDTIVMTWTLCSIPDAPAALREMRRVLKPEGDLLFVEHGLSSDAGVQRWQHRLNPVWRHIAGGCNLDRKMDDLIRSAGFDLKTLKTEYAPGPRAMGFMYQGCACQRGRLGDLAR